MFFQSSQVSLLEFHPVFDSTVLQSIQVNFNTKCKVGVDGEGTGRLSDKIFCTKRILLHIHACMCVSLFFFGDHHEARLTWSGSQFPCFRTKRQQSCHHHTAGLKPVLPFVQTSPTITQINEQSNDEHSFFCTRNSNNNQIRVVFELQIQHTPPPVRKFRRIPADRGIRTDPAKHLQSKMIFNKMEQHSGTLRFHVSLLLTF